MPGRKLPAQAEILLAIRVERVVGDNPQTTASVLNGGGHPIPGWSVIVQGNASPARKEVREALSLAVRRALAPGRTVCSGTLM